MRALATRPATAITLLAVVCLADLVAAGAGVPLGDGPVVMVLALLAGFLVGATSSSLTAVLVTVGAAAMLAAGSRLADPSAHSLADDAAFYLVLVACPVIVGAGWAARALQIAETRRLTDLVAARRAADVRSARLEQQSALSAELQRGVIQTMGAIAIRASGGTLADGEMPGTLEDIESIARRALEELRDHLGVLREPVEPVTDLVPLQQPRSPGEGQRLGPVDLLAAATAVPVAVETVAGAHARGSAWLNVAAAVALALALVVRRSRPLPAAVLFAAVTTTASAALTPLPVTVSVLLPLVVMGFGIGAHLSGRSRVVGAITLLGGCLTMSAVSPPGDRDFGGLGPTLAWTTVAVLAGALAQGHTRRVAALRELLVAAERGRDAELRLATAQARHAVARDLHDTMAAALTVICLHASGGGRVGPAEAQGSLRTIADTARSAVSEIRSSLEVLDDPPVPAAGLGAVAEVIAQARHAGLDVTFTGDPDDPGELPPTLVRLVREALINVARHAPGACADVRVAWHDGVAEVEVRDDGARAGVPRLPVLGTGQGLAGLAERIHAEGGTLSYGPLMPRGFRVVARLAPVKVPG